MAAQDVKIVRILLVGDSQCGKTSIILALVGEEFPLFVPPRAEEITIPGDVTPEKVPTHIVDFSAQEQDDDVLQDEISKAHVICVVYDLTVEDAFDRVTGYWLPLIRQSSGNASKPVILAGNKSDLPYDADGHNVRLQDVLNAYLEVETGIECSAKDLQNVSELFYFAQKAVLHPTAPLYSISEGSLKPACITALERIFKICDIDNDGILCDQELNDFQIRCFDAPLQPQALQDVKNIVQHNTPLGVYNDGLTLDGFLFLNKLFILRGRHETTWKVLRRFGYNNGLTLRGEYLHPPFSPQRDSTVELSEEAIQFLTNLFKRYDKDSDEALSSIEQEDLFSMCPEYIWDDLIACTVETTDEGWVTLEGFLAYWVLQTSLDYSYTAQFLAWMGYSAIEKGGLASALKEVLPRDKSKTVFRCKIMGGRGCGKTTFCRALILKSKESLLQRDEDEVICIKSLSAGNSRIYLILHECSYDPQEQYYTGGNRSVSGLLENCDLVCLLYDQSERTSFQSAAQLFNAIDSTLSELIPCIFVSTKSDLAKVEQVGEQQPEEFCIDVGLPPPLSVSYSQPDSLSATYSRLATVAIEPSRNIPSSIRVPQWIRLAGVGLLVTAGLGSLIFLLVRASRSSFKRS